MATASFPLRQLLYATWLLVAAECSSILFIRFVDLRILEKHYFELTEDFDELPNFMFHFKVCLKMESLVCRQTQIPWEDSRLDFEAFTAASRDLQIPITSLEPEMTISLRVKCSMSEEGSSYLNRSSSFKLKLPGEQSESWTGHSLISENFNLTILSKFACDPNYYGVDCKFWCSKPKAKCEKQALDRQINSLRTRSRIAYTKLTTAGHSEAAGYTVNDSISQLLLGSTPLVSNFSSVTQNPEAALAILSPQLNVPVSLISLIVLIILIGVTIILARLRIYYQELSPVQATASRITTPEDFHEANDLQVFADYEVLFNGDCDEQPRKVEDDYALFGFGSYCGEASSICEKAEQIVESGSGGEHDADFSHPYHIYAARSPSVLSVRSNSLPQVDAVAEVDHAAEQTCSGS